MIMKMEDGFLLARPEPTEVGKLKNLRMFKENKKEGYWYAEISKTMLERMQKEFGLTAPAQRELIRLRRVQKAVDRVRNTPDDKLPDVVKFPVKASLFAHQRRGVIMTLLTFGVLKPEEVFPDDVQTV